MEPVILYFVLFFPAILYEGPIVSEIRFSVVRELGRILTYTLPSLALLWYLISDKKGFSALRNERPGKRDLLSFGAGLPGLIIIGLGISFLVSHFSDYPGLALPPMVEAPADFPGWIVMVVSCMGTGYLEESFFRYYLLKWQEKLVSRPVFRIFFSTALFSLCHVYEGPWGIFNAVLAGILLSVLFIRFKTLHGIAWAHGTYNIFVYAMSFFM